MTHEGGGIDAQVGVMLNYLLLCELRVKVMTTIVTSSNNKNPLAVMHNDLVRASYDMTVNELRLLLIVLSQMPKSENEEFDPNQPCYVTKEDFVRLGVEPKNVVREIRTACKLMRKKEFRIDTPVGELIYPIFDSVLNVKDEVYKKLKDKYPNSKYDEEFIRELRLYNLLDVLDVVANSDANIVVRMVIHREVVPYLVKLRKNFTKLYLDEFFTFSSSYSFRIYFMMMQFRDEKKAKWWCKISLKDLRNALMLEDKYKANKDLKKWVIEAAIDEINNKSPIEASYELEMTGKKYTHLILKYQLKDKKKSKSIDVFESAEITSIKRLTDKQLARAVHSKKFMADYNGLVTAQSSVNQSSSAWISHMVEWVKKDPENFTKRPMQEYLDDEQAPRF